MRILIYIYCRLIRWFCAETLSYPRIFRDFSQSSFLPKINQQSDAIHREKLLHPKDTGMNMDDDVTHQRNFSNQSDFSFKNTDQWENCVHLFPFSSGTNRWFIRSFVWWYLLGYFYCPFIGKAVFFTLKEYVEHKVVLKNGIKSISTVTDNLNLSGVAVII